MTQDMGVKAEQSPATDGLVERLKEGVSVIGLHEDNETDMYDIEDADEAMIEAATLITQLQADIARKDEALRTIVEHCANEGYGNPIVNERIVDRCQETALEALSSMPVVEGEVS